MVRKDVSTKGTSFKTRQVYNMLQEPAEQLPLGFSIAEEKIRQF